MKNSSKSTPMMSFKSGPETENKEREILLKEKSKIDKEINTVRISGEINPSQRIKVSKTRDRVSITSKEDVMRYSQNNFNFTPDNKPSTKIKKQGSIDTTKPKSISINNFQYGLVTPHSSTNSTPTAQPKYNSNPQLITSNCVLTTNYSDTHKEEQCAVSSNNNLTASPKKLSEVNYLVQTIQTLGTMIKSSESPNTVNEIMSSGQNAIKINKLNSLLNNISLNNKECELKETANENINHELIMPKLQLNDSKNLLMENNVIRRDTFIDNNFNKKFQVDKQNIMNEIYTTSDIRMKKYGILFDFINTNIKEITEMVSQNTTNRNHEEQHINNIIFDKEAVKALNEEDVSMKKNNLLNNMSNSFMDSPSDLDFYKNLIEHTIVNGTLNDNFSQDMSSFRSKVDKSHVNDQTHVQYDDYHFKSRTYKPNKNVNNDETCMVEPVNDLSVPRYDILKIKPIFFCLEKVS